MYSIVIDGGRMLGLGVHPGQGYYVVGLDCKTGKPLFNRIEEQGFQGKPTVRLLPHLYGPHAVAMLRDGQNFELRAYDIQSGKLAYTLAAKGAGDWGEHGHVSAVVQDGRLGLLSKDKLKTASAAPTPR